MTGPTTPAPFVGIDLAWGDRARTGVATVDESGALVACGSVRTDTELDAWLDRHTSGVRVVAVDAPVVVTNPSGARACEREVTAAFRPFEAGCHPTNLATPHMNPPRATSLALRHGWGSDPLAPDARPLCLEVYPHAAMVGLFDLRRTLKYKRGPFAIRRDGLLEVLRLLGGIGVLALADHPRWSEISSLVTDATRPFQLDAVEDEVDAVLCAHLAWLWVRQPDALRLYGDPAQGCIVAPPAPSASRIEAGLRPASRR